MVKTLINAGLFCLLSALSAASLAAEPPSPPEDDANAKKRAAIKKMYVAYKKQFADTPDLTEKQLVELRKSSPPILVDVRDAAERKVSVIPGAISKESFEKHEADHEGKKIVVYCTIGYRSGLYAKRLRKRGADAVNLIGGILLWTHAGRGLRNDKGKTRSLHVYAKKWDLAADGYRTVWYRSGESRDQSGPISKRPRGEFEKSLTFTRSLSIFTQ